jgi:hypothetical protein
VSRGNVEQALEIADIEARLAGPHQQAEQPQSRPIGEPGKGVAA